MVTDVSARKILYKLSTNSVFGTFIVDHIQSSIYPIVLLNTLSSEMIETNSPG